MDNAPKEKANRDKVEEKAIPEENRKIVRHLVLLNVRHVRVRIPTQELALEE